MLKALPELIGNAVEEFLRYDSSVQLAGRVALEDIDDVGGKKIVKGEAVLACWARPTATARTDCPDSLDITRRTFERIPLAAASLCLGARLARIEVRQPIAKTLLRRLPDLRPGRPVRAEWRPTFVLRGLTRMPARW